jgi:hypothetical protein
MTPFPNDEARRAAFAKKTPPPSKPGTSPLSAAGRNYGANAADAVFQGTVAAVANALMEYLPDEISSAGVVSLDAWPEHAGDSLLAAKQNGELDIEDPDDYLAQHEAALKEAVAKELRQRGIQVVPRQQEALRILADTHQLRTGQLKAFESIIVEPNASVEKAREAELHGNDAYTVLVDGTLRRGIQPGERYVVVRG